MTIKVASITRYPGGCFHTDGDFNSAEDVFHEILGTFRDYRWSDDFNLTIDLDGTTGYSSSFLEGLFSRFRGSENELGFKVHVKSSDSSLVLEYLQYMKQ